MVQRLTIDGVSIEQIPKDELKYSFTRIEPYLQKIREKSYSDWIIPDIYVSLREETSTLYMFYKEDAFVGFVITQLVKDPSGEGTLYVWASYQKPEYNYIKVGFDFLDKLANSLGAVAVEFETSRKGWQRTAKKFNFELVTYTFRKELWVEEKLKEVGF